MSAWLGLEAIEETSFIGHHKPFGNLLSREIKQTSKKYVLNDIAGCWIVWIAKNNILCG